MPYVFVHDRRLDWQTPPTNTENIGFLLMADNQGDVLETVFPNLHQFYRYFKLRVAVSEADKRTVFLGLSWGLNIKRNPPWEVYPVDGLGRRWDGVGRLSGNWLNHRQALEWSRNNHRTRPTWTDVPDPHSGQWEYANEPAMVKHLKEGVTEGLEEKVFLAIRHWADQVDILDEWETAKTQIVGPNAEQEIERITRWVANHRPAAHANKSRAVIEYLRLQNDLATDFSGATTMAQVEAVCAKYVTGTFGVDWHVPDFFKWDRSYHAWQEQEAQLKDDRKQFERDLRGHVRNPFATRLLKPFLKKRPHLANLYGA